jgi:hypothetical protein
MQYGLLPEAANQFNPDALPIGISKTAVATPVKGWPAGDYAGLTCAACHEGEWDYKGKHVRIDGGAGNRLDILAYIHALDDALQETLSDSAKFDRLAARLGAASSDAEDKLRKRFERDADRVHHYRTRTAISATPWGPGRLDAIALILNRLLADLPDIPQNWSTPNAPPKPPFLWNAPHGLWTQWRVAQQDPIYRNLGETMGVYYMPIDLTSKSPTEGLFQSNALFSISNGLKTSWIVWRHQVGRKMCLARSTARRPRLVKPYLFPFAPVATTRGLTRGANLTSMASASSW